MMTGFGGMGFGGMAAGGVGFLFMAIFWIGVVAAAIWLLSNLFPKNNVSDTIGGNGETAVSILQKRYARGEIDKEQFEQMRHELES